MLKIMSIPGAETRPYSPKSFMDSDYLVLFPMEPRISFQVTSSQDDLSIYSLLRRVVFLLK